MVPDVAIKIYSSSVLDMAKWNFSGVSGVEKWPCVPMPLCPNVPITP
jgi:hypothetical protein